MKTVPKTYKVIEGCRKTFIEFGKKVQNGLQLYFKKITLVVCISKINENIPSTFLFVLLILNLVLNSKFEHNMEHLV